MPYEATATEVCRFFKDCDIAGGPDGMLLWQRVMGDADADGDGDGDADGEYGDGEYGDGEYGDGEYGDGEYGDCEYGDGEYGDYVYICRHLLLPE